MPQRIQRKRVKGWRMPKNTVYVGRPTYWRNFFLIIKDDDQSFVITDLPKYPKEWLTRAKTLKEARAIAKKKFEDWLLSDSRDYVRKEVKEELRGKNLACWCPLNQPCHADVLLGVANAED